MALARGWRGVLRTRARGWFGAQAWGRDEGTWGGFCLMKAWRPVKVEVTMRLRQGPEFESRDSVPVKVWRLIAEECDPGTDAAGGVVEDAVLAAAHALGRVVPEALRALVDEACGELGAEGADPVKRHDDALAAVVAELTLEVQLAR